MEYDEVNDILPSAERRRDKENEGPSINASISDQIDDDDDAPLLEDEEIEKENDKLIDRIKTRKWWFWAEIVFFFWAFCDYPSTFVMQKYTLDQITLKNWQYDLDHNITHSFDIFNSSISENTCVVNTSSDAYMFSQRNQMMASHFLMVRMSIWIIPAMISNIIFGSISDSYGRRWVFFPPLLGSFCCSTILTFITFYKADIYYLMIIDVINGMGGSFGCIILATVAYVAGQTSSKTRLLRLTILQVFSLIAASISPPVMGELLDYLGTPITLFINSFLSGFNLIYCIIFLPNFPESRSSSKKGTRFSFDNYHSDNTFETQDNRLLDVSNSSEDENILKKNICSVLVEQFRNTIDLYTRNRKWLFRDSQLEIVKPENYDDSAIQSTRMHQVPNNAVRLRILLLGFFTVCVPLFDPQVLVLYMLNSPLCWSQAMIGLYTGLSTLVCAIGSVFLTKLFGFCFDHTSIAILCCIVCAFSRIYVYFVQDTLMMFLGIAFLPLTNIVVPSIRTLMTLLVPESKHGSVLGSLGSIEVLCCYIAAILFSEVYAATLFISTAFVFVVSGTILFLSIFIFIVFKIKYKGDQAIHFTDSLNIPSFDH